MITYHFGFETINSNWSKKKNPKKSMFTTFKQKDFLKNHNQERTKQTDPTEHIYTDPQYR